MRVERNSIADRHLLDEQGQAVNPAGLIARIDHQAPSGVRAMIVRIADHRLE
jgi:hypothetical protein